LDWIRLDLLQEFTLPRVLPKIKGELMVVPAKLVFSVEMKCQNAFSSNFFRITVHPSVTSSRVTGFKDSSVWISYLGFRRSNIRCSATGSANWLIIKQFAPQVTKVVLTSSFLTYFVFFATCNAQAVYYDFTMVEMKGRTLEELNEIFRQHPRNASLIWKEEIEEPVNQIREGLTELEDLKIILP
jgi:hypothetical protein